MLKHVKREFGRISPSEMANLTIQAQSEWFSTVALPKREAVTGAIRLEASFIQ